MSLSSVSGSIVKVLERNCKRKVEVYIGVRAVSIERIVAKTPALGGVEVIFDAWWKGREVSGGGGNFDGLVSEVMEEVCGVEGAMWMSKAGLLLATTKGDMGRVVEWMREMDAGGDDGSVVPTLGGDLKRPMKSWGFGGPSYVVSTACASGLVALMEGAMLILDGEADQMVVLGADVPEGFVRSGFQALKAISSTRCRPCDRERDGLMLGAAAGACVLTRAEKEGPGCVISGWGIANDATHMTAPDREARGLVQAIRQAA